jgi:hypothetical protein
VRIPFRWFHLTKRHVGECDYFHCKEPSCRRFELQDNICHCWIEEILGGHVLHIGTSCCTKSGGSCCLHSCITNKINAPRGSNKASRPPTHQRFAFTLMVKFGTLFYRLYHILNYFYFLQFINKPTSK